ncbi:uncharacterized protein SPSC_02445 [Sporisorium scitamineum]|uniref:Uncharacterized protein n=1 Tax=Sporisorium scitamineum TaxID=49012 RepID=A0A0F7RTN8_9BASI|nr:hypothetical protein [Sporisorium scitamineum]CDU23816.1 uncharacterized protein SPSC_02445 [Sporisorium scitamineum]
MNAACTAAATPTGAAVTSSTTPPLPNTAPTAAHYRLGRTSRRSSSSGSSSSSSGGFVNHGGNTAIQQGSNASKKRRRHSTLSSGIASGSEEECERAPPMFRLRLGSYVSDLRLARTRSHSPSSPLHQTAAPLSPSGALRQRHQLSIQTTALVDSSARQQDQQRNLLRRAPASVSPTSPASTSMLAQRDSDVDMDLDVQSTFQAMQVDSPTASPSPTVATANAIPFFASTFASPPPPPVTRMAMHRTASARISPIPTSLLSPLVTDTRYPRAPSPLSAPASASFPSISLVAHASSTAVSPGVFPSQSLLAARRNSRQSSLVPPQQHHAPASPSPLARILSFPPSTAASHNTPQHQHLNAASSQLDSSVSFQHPFLSQPLSQQQSQQQQQTQNQNRSRANSTPPSPSVGAVVADDGQPPPAMEVGAQLSPFRRHSDGRPSRLPH